MTKEIQLTQGKVAIVDDEDFNFINQWHWNARQINGHWYAKRGEAGKTIFMHRIIMNAPKGLEVDHIDGDGLNNLRENLRVCTHAENLRNQRLPRHNKSGYKGVLPYINGKVRALIQLNGEKIFLGIFDNAEEAAHAYDAKAIELYGEFARLNFPNEKTGERKPVNKIH